MWYKTIFPAKELEGMIKEDITIIHNIDEIGTCGNAFCSWWLRLRGKEAKVESFVEYINSKTHMSGHKAFTEEEFKKKFPNITPKYQR